MESRERGGPVLGMVLLYRMLGVICVALGLIGTFVPVLPTTPFLLLALWFFSKGSPGMRRWLLTNRLCGRYLEGYYSGRGMPVSAKVFTIVLLWGGILYASVRAVDAWWLRALLLTVAVAVSIHVVRIKTRRAE